MNTMTIQWKSSAIAWVATVVAQTDERATMAPTDRSMPPPQMTKVMPTPMTPITEASRRIVMALSNEPKRSPAVARPTTQSRTSAISRPRLRPKELASRRGEGLCVRGLPAALWLAVRSGVGAAGAGAPWGAVASTLMRRLLS